MSAELDKVGEGSSSQDGIMSIPKNDPPFRLSRAGKDVAFGSIAGMVAKIFEHPFDLVKVRLQTQPSDRAVLYSGAFDCFRQTFQKEGARGLFRGLSMPIFGATLENATLFSTYNFVQGQLRDIAGQGTANGTTSTIEADAENPLSMKYLSIAAAAAGAATSFVLTPVELIKCKMQVQMVTREIDVLSRQHSSQDTSTSRAPGAAVSRSPAVPNRTVSTTATNAQLSKSLATLDGPLTILGRILREDGVRGLWLGQVGTLLRETGGGIAWFLAFEWTCRTLIRRKQSNNASLKPVTKKDLSSTELMGAGALAGISYNVVLFPADSVKSTMQTEREWASGKNSSVYRPKGFLQTLQNIYKTRGIRGLYAGCGVTCMRSAPSSALIFLLYNRLEGLADDYGI